MRLIDADALMKTVFNDVVLVDGEVKGVGLILAETVDKAPTIGAVPVVRCKDCVNGTFCLNSQGAEYVDCMLDDYSVRKPDDFCSYGERKEGNDNG